MRQPKSDGKCKNGKNILTMKTLLLLIALVFSASAFASIGETTEQSDKRYGRPLETTRNNVENRRYEFRGFTILVSFEGGISQCEVYQRQDNYRMTEAEIQGWLQANVGSSEWGYEPEENTNNYVYWSRDRKTRVATYTLATHRLMVTSKAYLDRSAKRAKSSERKK
jgi:hypothetical protein